MAGAASPGVSKDPQGQQEPLRWGRWKPMRRGGNGAHVPDAGDHTPGSSSRFIRAAGENRCAGRQAPMR